MLTTALLDTLGDPDLGLRYPPDQTEGWNAALSEIRHRIERVDTHAMILRACGDPGSIVTRAMHFDAEGDRVYEPLIEWQARAVVGALAPCWSCTHVHTEPDLCRNVAIDGGPCVCKMRPRHNPKETTP